MPSVLAYVQHYVNQPVELHNGGAEMTLHAAIVALSRAGWDARVLLSEEKPFGDYEVDGVSVIVPKDDVEVRRRPFAEFARSDLIFSHLAPALRAGLIGRRKTKTPVVHFIHNDGPFTYSMANTNTDFNIINTEWIRNRWPNVPGIVLHPIVDVDNYKVRSTRKEISLVNLSTDLDGFYDKGHHTFYNLAQRNPDLSFLGVKGGYGTQDVRILDNVRIVNHGRDIKKALASTRALLLPSKYESYGRVAVEANASGIPVIASNLPGVHEALGDGGLYCDYGMHDQFDKNLHLVLDDYKYYSDKAKANAQFVKQRTEQEKERFVDAMTTVATKGVKGWERSVRSKILL